MGHSVSYKEGAWNDMGDAINRMSAWRSGIFDRMRAMDQVFRNLRDRWMILMKIIVSIFSIKVCPDH